MLLVATDGGPRRGGSTPLSITPNSANVGPTGGLTFSGLGGTPGYTYTLFANNSGGTINGTTGVYAAGTTGSVSDTVRVTDSAAAHADAVVTVAAAVGVSPSSATKAPGGSQTFAGTGGSGSYTYSLFTNNSGGSIDATTGVYTAGSTGSVSDTVRVTDTLSQHHDATVTVTAVVAISPSSLSAAPYATQTFTASNGSGSGYVYSLAVNNSGGSIDAGTGVYTAGGTGSVTDTVRVTDSLSQHADSVVTLSAAPSDIADLQLWLDGRDIVGADGAAIATWTARSGNNATAFGVHEPAVKLGVNGINGLPVALFDGTNTYMRSTFSPGSVGLTFYIVARTGASLTSYGTVLGSGGAPSNDNPTAGIEWAFSNGSAVDTFGAGWGGATGTLGLGNVAGITTNQTFKSRYRTNKVAWSIVGPNTGTPADTSFPTGTYQVHVGSEGTSFSSPTFGFVGSIACILAYSRALTGPEDAAVLAYLANVWGV